MLFAYPNNIKRNLDILFAYPHNVRMVFLPSGDWITVADTAGLLDLSERRVQILIKSQRLKATRLGQRVYILLRSDVLAFKEVDRPAGRPKTTPPDSKSKKPK